VRGGGRFYAIRQARIRIIGSRTMTLAQARREVAVWRAEIGPAVVVPATKETRRAVRAYDQVALSALLTGTAQPRCAHPDCIDPTDPHISHGDH
jgi:hypothetical protein